MDNFKLLKTEKIATSPTAHGKLQTYSEHIGNSRQFIIAQDNFDIRQMSQMQHIFQVNLENIFHIINNGLVFFEYVIFSVKSTKTFSNVIIKSKNENIPI